MEKKNYNLSVVRTIKYVCFLLLGALLVFLVLIGKTAVNNNEIINLGDKYFFNTNEIVDIKKIKYSYTEFTNHHLSSIEKDGEDILYSWRPGDITIKKVRYNDDFIVVKGEHRDRENEFYFLVVQKNGDVLHGPFTPVDFLRFQSDKEGELLYILDGFIETADLNW